MRSRRVLVVDDVVDTAEMLEVMGHEVAFTTDSRKALDLAKKFHPDIVFLDIDMPHVDGYELARMLRAVPELKSLCIVAVSGHDTPEDRARGRKSGFDAHLPKPSDLAVVKAVLAQFEDSC